MMGFHQVSQRSSWSSLNQISDVAEPRVDLSFRRFDSHSVEPTQLTALRVDSHDYNLVSWTAYIDIRDTNTRVHASWFLWCLLALWLLFSFVGQPFAGSLLLRVFPGGFAKDQWVFPSYMNFLQSWQSGFHPSFNRRMLKACCVWYQIHVENKKIWPETQGHLDMYWFKWTENWICYKFPGVLCCLSGNFLHVIVLNKELDKTR